MRVIILATCALALQYGFVTISSARDTPIEPSEAIQRAAAVPESGVSGVFAITVRGTGKTDARQEFSRERTLSVGPTYYLNSEVDYRDQRCLTIALTSEVAADLKKQFGESPERALKGRQILVSGVARRVKIDFVSNGQPTGKFYYQTHVDVSHASQIRVL